MISPSGSLSLDCCCSTMSKYFLYVRSQSFGYWVTTHIDEAWRPVRHHKLQSICEQLLAGHKKVIEGQTFVKNVPGKMRTLLIADRISFQPQSCDNGGPLLWRQRVWRWQPTSRSLNGKLYIRILRSIKKRMLQQDLHLSAFSSCSLGASVVDGGSCGGCIFKVDFETDPNAVIFRLIRHMKEEKQ